MSTTPEITLTPEIVQMIEAMIEETMTDSCSQPVAVDEVNGKTTFGMRYGLHHNTAQRDFMGQQAYRLAVAVRRQRGES
jgi:hypothetical protein